VNLIQITPGAGAMYCGNCLRDNALVAALRKQGHQVVMTPLYLPLTLDEEDQSARTPLFFSGLNVYLEQKAAFFRAAPGWLHRLLARPGLVKWAAGKAAGTRPALLGELTLSMLRGEEGNQAREIEVLIAWLKTQPMPDAICLSNVLLGGLVRRLKAELRAPVVCALQGEDAFLDALPQPHRAACWKALAERVAEVNLFIAPSRYFADLMRSRLGLPAERVRIVWNGIDLADYSEATAPGATPPDPRPTLGFFARMCPEKGLDVLVAAYIHLRQSGRVGDLGLRIGGSCGPAEASFVNSLRQRLRESGLQGDVEFHPNLDHAAKLRFLRSLSVFSVPAVYGEAFGLYVLEALAAGVPLVQPRSGAFPELLEATGGGVLCAPGDLLALARAVEELLLKPDRGRALGQAGRRAVFAGFSSAAMARAVAEAIAALKGKAL
jgi:glycosyltransferase involved in cell wall biosynthesis